MKNYAGDVAGHPCSQALMKLSGILLVIYLSINKPQNFQLTCSMLKHLQITQ